MAEEKNWSEKRRDVRVPVSIGTKAWKLSLEKEKAVQLLEKDAIETDKISMPEDGSNNDWHGDTSIALFTDFMAKIEDESDPVISYFANSLIKIGEKLDLIIEKSGEKYGQENNDKRVKVKKTVDISGTGVSLLVEEPVKVGTALEISLQIPGFPLGWYTTFTRIVHVKSIKDTDKEYFNIGMKYVGSSRKDYERLVAFTFSQQRKNIRRSK